MGVRFEKMSEKDILDYGQFPNLENCEISRWEMGTLNYEGLVGFEACVDYLASLSKDGADPNSKDTIQNIREPKFSPRIKRSSVWIKIACEIFFYKPNDYRFELE